MATSWTAIASNTVGSGGVASVTFSSIPGTYTDLLVKCSARSDFAGVNASIYVAPNNASTNLSSRSLHANSTTALSASYSVIIARDTSANTSTSNTFGNAEFYIPNYASANYKSVSLDTVGENNASTGSILMGIQAGLWSSTSAITSLVLTTDGNFMQYSTFTLFGVKNT
jgi:hypothetical protein